MQRQKRNENGENVHIISVILQSFLEMLYSFLKSFELILQFNACIKTIDLIGLFQTVDK